MEDQVQPEQRSAQGPVEQVYKIYGRESFVISGVNNRSDQQNIFIASAKLGFELSSYKH